MGFLVNPIYSCIHSLFKGLSNERSDGVILQQSITFMPKIKIHACIFALSPLQTRNSGSATIKVHEQ